MASDSKAYDQVAEFYDLLISWKERLRREKPFFKSIFKEYGVARILDSACGTGKHAAAFHDWGFHVVGADPSRQMLKKARQNAGERKIKFVRAELVELEKTGGMFDAVTCLGNSLPHVISDEELDRSLASMLNVLLPGGIAVIHNNNYDLIVEKRQRFMPPAHAKRRGREYVFVRFFDFHGETLTFNLLALVKGPTGWEMFRQAMTHRALTSDLLVSRLERAGFKNIRVYGGYPAEPFEKLKSDAMVVVAQKPHTSVSRPTPEPVAAIDAVPIRENGEPLVDLGKAAPEIEVRDCPALARRTVVELLRKAERLLPEGYRLKVKTAHRSLEHQREMYDGLLRQLAHKHPDWPNSRLRREANKFLAPPDAKHPPGHTTGGAVDVAIVGTDGKELDMRSSIPGRQTEGMTTLPTYSRNASPRAAKNRQMLVDAMSAAGFSNYPGEWWHWSYGDSAWALRTGHPYAVYGCPATQNR